MSEGSVSGKKALQSTFLMEQVSQRAIGSLYEFFVELNP
jgi:hypothetical protein